MEVTGSSGGITRSGWRILIVDDDRDFVDTLTDILEPLGCITAKAHTARQARETIQSFEAGVALLDIRLGRHSGIDLIADLRSVRPDIICIVMTAYAGVDNAVEALQEGAYDYLQKPVSTPELIKTLDRAFERLRLETEKRAAEEALRRSEERFRTVVVASKDAMMTVEQDGRISVFNPAAEKMFGRAQGEMLGEMTWFPLAPPDLHEQLRQYVRRVLDNEAPFEFGAKTLEINALRHDGAPFPAELSISSGQHKEGQFALIVIRDLTERQRLEEQLYQAQKMEAIGHLAGGIAHDFNNLLQAILCNIQFALQDIPESNRTHQDLEEALDASKRAARLTQQLLTFSRRQILMPHPLSLNDLIDSFMNMIRRVIGEHIDLRFIPGAELLAVNGDQGQIEQVLMNLFVNARDAIDGTGAITLETRNVMLEEAPYEHPHAWHGRYVLMTITDTGRGMTPETLKRLFEPFFTTKDTGKGTGLGLATVYGIVRQHNGFIQVSSQPGKGATFQIYLPAIDGQPVTGYAVAEETTLSAQPKGGKETVLVAEDDAPVRNVAVRVLKQAGYRVLVAGDGEEALKILAKRRGKIDLLVSDVVMPKVGGPQVYAKLKTDYPGVRVLFTSGYNVNTLTGDAFVDPDVPFLPKPYTPPVLLEKVREVLDA